MTPFVTWLVLTLLSSASAQNATSDQTLNQAQNPADKTPHNDTIETATNAPGQEHEPHLHSPNEDRDEMPRLKFNPPDLIPFPKEGQVTQFWRDHPDFRAIPNLPAKITEYPEWLLAVMGGFRPPTHASNPTENDQVLLNPNSRPLQQPEVKPLDSRTWESESGNFNSRILPRRNDMEGRFESNNIPVQMETGNTEFTSPPEIPIQQSLLNSRIRQFRPVPNNIQRLIEGRVIPDFSQNQNGPILFRVPLNIGLGRIQHIRNSNTQRNPNFFTVRNNRWESRPFSTAPVQMVPLQHQHFRGIPVTLSRPSVDRQPGILMLPVRNQNVPSRFSQPNFIQSHPRRMSATKEQLALVPNQNHPQNPSFSRQNAILVDPQLSREPWPMVPVEDENFQRRPTLTDRRQDFVIPGRQANTWPKTRIQSNGSSSLPRRSGIGARNKRQSGFESFEPFGMGNMFSFYPPEKEEPQNSFNWFPRESMMSSPTHQSPVSSGFFIPTANHQRPAKPPKQQINFPQDAWMILPPSSSNTVPNFQGQNPQTNHRSSNKQVPEDFPFIRPEKASPQSGSSNKMPWRLSNLFGGDLFPENGGNQMWTFQRPFDHQSETNNKQSPHANGGLFSNNVPTRPLQGGRVPPPNDQQFPVQPPVSQPVQNFHPNRGQTEHSHLDNNIQRPSTHLIPPVNRNNINQGHIQATSHLDQVGTHVQPQENWRPVSQRPAQPQQPAVTQGTWTPRESTQEKAPVSGTNHFHEVAPPHHQQPHHHHPKKQPSRPAEVPASHEDRRQPHRTAIQPEIQKGKRKLSPSEVRHLLSLLPEFPKEIHERGPRQGSPKGQTVGLTIGAIGNRQKRVVHPPTLKSADIDDGNLTQNYPGPNYQNRMHQPDSFNAKHSDSSKLPVSSRNPQLPKDRKKRDIEDVVFGSYSEHDYQDDSFSDYSDPYFGFTANNNHDSGDLWGNMFPKRSHNLFNGVWDWPNHDYYRPHLGFGHFPHGHAAGHLHPPHHPSHYWHGNVRPLHQGGRLPGDRRVVVIPPAVPRANPNQLSYTARFRYRFGIYPGYSDFIPSTDDHEIFFFYDAKQKDPRPDALIPFRSY